MDLVSSLVGIAGGSIGTSLVNWLTGRRKAAGEEQITITEVAARYWDRIEKLETRVAELTQLNASLTLELAKRDQVIGELQASVARLEQRVEGGD